MQLFFDSRRARQMAALAALGLCSLAYTTPANAATTSPFGCRASLARVGLLNATILEPVVANQASSPCASDTQGVQAASVPTVKNFLALAGPAGAYTFSSADQPTTTGAVAPGATALASIDGVTIPTTGGGSIRVVGPVEATASYSCVNGSLTSSSSSTLTLLYINGTKITIFPDRTTKIPLGFDSYVSVNEKLQTSNSIGERILDVHLSGLADVVLGEAKVTVDHASPCAGTNSTPPPSINPCPKGSTFDAVHQVCVIVTPGGTTIIISRPFAGPTGGTVVPLGAARKKYHSPCLFGPGPQYAIVGTNKADRINGTHRGERILGLGGNDRLAGQSGSDCLDGASGRDRIWAGNGGKVRVWGGTGSDRISVQDANAFADGGSGNDRMFLGNGNDTVYGRAGNDRLSVGRGNDKVWGGSGNDALSAGNGNDMLDGGAGNDRLYVGNGRDHIYGGAGNDRLYGLGEVIYESCGVGRDRAFVGPLGSSWAARHGCEKIRLIKPHKL